MVYCIYFQIFDYVMIDCTMLYCTVLCCTLLDSFNAIFCDVSLYETILDHIILYCICPCVRLCYIILTALVIPCHLI